MRVTKNKRNVDVRKKSFDSKTIKLRIIKRIDNYPRKFM